MSRAAVSSPSESPAGPAGRRQRRRRIAIRRRRPMPPTWQLPPLALALLLLLVAAATATAAAAPLGFVRDTLTPLRKNGARAAAAAGGGGGGEEEPPTAVVIVPGYASDAAAYRRLESSFRQRGIPAWTVPLSGPMWAPTFGGRSIRPILDRLHATVLDVALKARPLPPVAAAVAADGNDGGQQEQQQQQQQRAGQYSAGAFLKEMADPSQGARFPPSVAAAGGGKGEGDDPPPTQEFGREELRYRVALVAHSAGGWISRLYLSTASYDGRAYNGARFVSALVTLGSPHIFPPRFRGAAKVPYALRNLQFVNDRCTGPAGGDWERRVRCVCVGGRTLSGGTALGGMVKDWAGYSYEISGYDEEGVWGDGITPLESALGLPGAIARVELEGVQHGPEVEAKGQRWYGSDPEPLERWLGYVLPDPAKWPASAPSSSSSSSSSMPGAGAKEGAATTTTAAQQR